MMTVLGDFVHIYEHISQYDEREAQRQACFYKMGAVHFQFSLPINIHSSTLLLVVPCHLYALLGLPSL